MFDNIIKELEKTMRGLKGEYTSITQAQKYDAQSTELLEAKKRSLTAQLANLADQTKLYNDKQVELKQSLESGGMTLEQYNTSVAKLEQNKQKLHYTAIGLTGQLSSLGGTTQMGAVAMKDLADSTDKSTKASQSYTNSLRTTAKEMKQARSDAMLFLGVINGIANVMNSAINLVNDWNAVNADGTPKMTGMAKAMQLLSITTMAAAVAAQLLKSAWAGVFVGIAVAAIVAMVAAANNAVKSFDPIGSSGIQAYSGISASVNKITTQRSERTTTSNININANKYGADIANNPKVMGAIVDAVDVGLGAKIKGR